MIEDDLPELPEERSPGMGEVWRHEKTGGEYRIIALGRYEPTVEPVVVYQACSNGVIWVRPLLGNDGFMTPRDDGSARFTYMKG